LSNKYT
jgi:E3 ubiquitin-protein ligase BRE1